LDFEYCNACVEAGVSGLSLPLAMLVLFGLVLWTLHRERPSF